MMATCIFYEVLLANKFSYEVLLANKFSKDAYSCKNARWCSRPTKPCCNR